MTGPTPRITFSCEGCEHRRVNHFTHWGGAKGFTSWCALTSDRIGEDSSETPVWCPFVDAGVTRANEQIAQRVAYAARWNGMQSP